MNGAGICTGNLFISPYNGIMRDYQVLFPFGTIKCVQCKTGQLLKKRGAVFFRTAKQYPNGRFVPYTADADYFGVPVNNQSKGIRWAKDYVIPGKDQPGLANCL
jgi:hypothetical protein